MQIRVKETGAVMFEHELRALYPNVSGPLNALYDPVLEGPQATPIDIYGHSQRAGIELIDGKWFTKYILGPVFTDVTDADGETITAAAQEAAHRARIDEQRRASNKLEASRKLLETDYLMTPDASSSLANLADVIAYRAALREIAINPPVTVEAWPVKPAHQWTVKAS